MKLNKYKLPERVLAVMQGLQGDWPRPQKDVVHVTELQMPPFARNLYIEKYDEIVSDWSDYLLTTQGHALHEAYAKYLKHLGYRCEGGFAHPIDGVTLLGTPDVYGENVIAAYQPDRGKIVDVKQTAVWVPTYKKDDYTAQTNCYAWGLKKQGFDTVDIAIDIHYRNWQLKQASWSHDYPKIPYEEMSLPVWSFEQQEEYIKDQLHYLDQCKDECSRENRWQKYSVMKNRNKTPSKNCTTLEQAEAWIRAYQADPKKKDRVTAKFIIVDSEPTCCMYYCKSRSVCPYALSLKGKK